MAAPSLAGELLEIINENRYKTTFKHLSEDHAVSNEVIKSLKKNKSGGRDYDTSRFQNRRGNINPDGLYSLFTKYAGETCNEIRDKLSSWVIEHRSEIKDLTNDSFKTHRPDFSWWNLAIINKRRPGDELSLFCLCKIYHRHAIIYTEIDYWTTLEDTTNQSEEEIISKCDIVLVYLGNNKFCEIVKTKNDSGKTLRKRVTKSISELCSGNNPTGIVDSFGKRTKSANPRVRLNPTKHNHDTRGSVRKRHNDRPNRVQSRSVSYVPDPTSSETENEPPRRKRRRDAQYEVGPSQTRIEAQRMITRQRLQTKNNVTSKLIGTCVVSPTPKVKEEGDDKQKIKLEIKVELSKPLTKEQKERRRRRNRKENEETEWEHIHYKPGKGFRKHCEHTVAQCKYTATTQSKSSHTGDQITESSNTNIMINVDGESVGVNTRNDNEREHEKSKPTTDVLEQSVNANNAKENERGEVNSTPTEAENNVNTNNADEKDNDEVQRTSTRVNTYKNGEDELGILNSSNPADTPARESNSNQDNDTNNKNNHMANNTMNNNGTETTEGVVPSNAGGPSTEPVTELNEARTIETNPSKVRDAADGLLLLSSGEETMDELALSQDENDTIEFNEELDMENMMTALHIDKQTVGPAPDNNNIPTLPAVRTHGIASTSNTANKTVPSRVQSQSTPPKGQIKIRNISLKKHKEPSRNYYCNTCNDNIPYKGLQALNNHHREKHNPVQCGVCNKWCSTPESLRRHSYDHYNKTEICSTCGETFHFKSELKSHLIIHDEREGIHQCMKGGCGKRYMRKGELVAHVKTHTGRLWKCPWKDCTYEAIDKRYLYQHKKGHTKNNYICKYCQDGFTHYMQRKRHYEKAHSH